jgi:hypothetical protein
MSRPRIPFLPLFLTILGVAFAAALVARIRAYNGGAGFVGMGGEVSSTISGPAATARHESTPAELGDPAGAGGSAQTGTIVPVPAKGQGSSTREQRYRELLNSPPPPGVVPTEPAGRGAAHQPGAPALQPKPQSTIAKIINAINPFSKPAAPANAAPPPGQGPQQQPKPNPDTPKQPPADKDPNTDTTPPQVLSVQFDPPSVHDGESASVIITAQDDLSGIRGISGTVTSPTGKALQGFACQREAPESNRYIGRVTVPRDAEEGNWHINFLNVSDMASNSLTMAYQQSPTLQQALLQVISSRSDKTAPTVAAAWLDRRAMRAGERNTLYVQASDDKSGVNLVSGVFLSPKQYARVGVACQPGEGDVWTCSFSMPVCLDCGDWQLEQIQLQDKASNMGAVTYKASPIVEAVKVNVMGESCDSTPPNLLSLIMETNQVPSTPQGTLVNVQIAVSDDGCGVSGVSGQVVGPTGGSAFFAFSAAGGDNWVGRMPIPPRAGKGIWKINWLQVMDKGNNLRVYYQDNGLLKNAVVNVR